MKKIAQFFALALLLNLVVSCQSGDYSENTSLMATTAAKTKGTKSALVNTDNAEAMTRFSLADIDISLEAMEMVAMNQMNAEDADAQAVMSINQALMGAEKEAQLLDVNFSMSDEPVENGMFIFSIESPDTKNLTLEMFDEEGYEMAANNKFDVNEGNNYKALNVNSMDNGAYLFRLKDDSGKELVRTVSISN
jgi:hypothetical protein